MPTRPSDNGYEQFLKTVTPFRLSLKSCSASLDRILFWKLREEKKHRPVREMGANYKLDYVGKDAFDVLGEFTLTVGDPQTKVPALKIECCFEGHFHTEKPLNKDYAGRFADSEFRVVIWPYFRQFVSDTTARMGIPPVTIPISTSKAAGEQGNG